MRLTKEGSWRKVIPHALFANDVSAKGLRFITREEGCPTQADGTLKVYNDAKGYATVGVGRLLHYSNYTAADVAKYHGKTVADAERMLHADAYRFVKAVNSLGLKLKQREFDALVSFAFNVGVGEPGRGGLLGSALVRYLKTGGRNPATVAGLFHHYDDGGLLRARRAREAALFSRGSYGF